MDSLFDALARILPIVIGIIWFLRRSGLGKNRSQEKEKSPLQVLKKTRREQIRPKEGSLESQDKRFFAQKHSPKATAEAEAFLSNLRPPSPKIPPQSVSEPESVFAETKERDLGERSPWNHLQEESTQGSTTLERLGTLPPVAQGVVWSVILDEPPALKE